MRATTPRRVVMLVFPDVQALDVFGPVETFSLASRTFSGEPPYELVLAARATRPLRTSSGVLIHPQAALTDIADPIDTLVVAGGRGARAAVSDEQIVGWIAEEATRARRVASVCTGAFLLAAAGLLDGRRATTHWGACAALARLYPSVEVDPAPIYVRDGDVYTSAGVTAGIDLALALVEEDLGPALARRVARELVLFVRRPGGQAQFSAALAGQEAETASIRELQAWIAGHLAEDLSVAALAERACMSPRNFARMFAREVGRTPASYVTALRLEAARTLLETTGLQVDEVARRCGFGTVETLRRSFARHLLVTPTDYRERFAA